MEKQNSSYKPVRPKKFAASRVPFSAESKFWKSFLTKSIEQQIASVSCVDFCPEPPHDFAVTSSTRVSVYDGQTFKVKKTISRFSDMAYSGVFRPDGRLLVAGGEMGIIQVFDLNSRLVLRQFKGHSRAVRWVRYPTLDKLHLFSGSDDSTGRWWDVATESELLKLEGHSDYVRSGSAHPSSGDVWATGSYDHTVNLWDVRTSSLIIKLQHGKPVEDVLFFPSGGLLASAGGNVVKIWDILGGGRLLHALGSHQKTVTSLCITSPIRVQPSDLVASGRLLTGSLDGHVKVFDINEFKVVHASKYDSPVMSIGISKAMSCMAVGTSKGKLFIRLKKNVAAVEEGEKTKNLSSVIYEVPKVETVLRPSNYRYFLRGRSDKATEGDFIVTQRRLPKLAEHDRHLRKFQHKEALLSSLKTLDPTVVLAVMEELIRRQGLLAVLSNLDSSALELLLEFLKRYVTRPRYSGILVPFTHKVLDKCAGDFGLSSSILNQVAILKRLVEDEVRLQESLQSLQGLLQPLIQASIR